MMFRIVIAIALLATCALGLVACGEDEDATSEAASCPRCAAAAEALAQAQRTIQEQRAKIDKLQRARERLDEEPVPSAPATLHDIQVENVVAQKKALEARILALTRRVAELEGQLREAGIEPRPGLEAQPPDRGKVLAADNEAGAVVISLGADDKVQPGFRYTVSRGTSYVAIVEITDVQHKQSAGKIIKGLQKLDVQPGDVVTSR